MTSSEVFSRFVPEGAVSYCDKLYQRLNFEFKIKKNRQTKMGDYRYNFQSGKQLISINNDLNPYAFLITYLHEIAHLVAFNVHGRGIQPHGKEWKRSFREIAQPMLHESIFPKPLLEALRNYFRNPKASSCSDPRLYQLLKKYDTNCDSILLKEIGTGEKFYFNEKLFLKLEKKRTRSVCQDINSGKKYLISEIAEVSTQHE